MIWAALPNGAKAAIGGALVALALIGGGLAYVASERRDAAAQEAQRIELRERRADEATRQRIRSADRSAGDADDDLDWLIRRFGVDRLRGNSSD